MRGTPFQGLAHPLPPNSTAIQFRILPPLYALNGGTLRVPTALGDCTLAFEVVSSGNPGLIAHGATITGDDLGVLHNTIVAAMFPVFIEFTSPGKDRSAVWEPLAEAVRALNIVIEHYRIVEQIPSIRRIATRHAHMFIHGGRPPVGGGSGQVGWVYGGLGLDPEGDDAHCALLGAGKQATYQPLVQAGNPHLARIIFSDALADIQTGNVRSGLAHLNIAFEMVIWSQHETLGRAVLGDAPYEAAHPTPEPGASEGPSIFSGLRECRGWTVSGPSKTRLVSDAELVRKHRNPIIHGRPVSISGDDLKDAVEAFQRVVIWLAGAKPRQVDVA